MDECGVFGHRRRVAEAHRMRVRTSIQRGSVTASAYARLARTSASRPMEASACSCVGIRLRTITSV